MALELSTEDKLEYQFHAVTSGSLHFKVRAPNDAHIALTNGPYESEPMYEVFIGGWGNTRSVIRRNRTKPDVAEADTPDILNGGEFRGFWIRWTGGVVTVGREGEAAAFLAYEDPQPFGISHYGICTGWGATGSWQIEDLYYLKTADRLQYVFQPIATGSMELDVRGPSDYHVVLTSSAGAPDGMRRLYEIILRGFERYYGLNYKREQHYKLIVPLPNHFTLSPNEFRRYHISWRQGRLVTRFGGVRGLVLMDWRDPNPTLLSISHMGIRAGLGGTPELWKLHQGSRDTPTTAPSVVVVFIKDFEGKSKAIDNQEDDGAIDETIGESEENFLPENGNSSPAGGWAAPSGGDGAACWVDAKGGEVPPNAVSGGKDGGEDLFVGRARHEGALIPGKVVPSHGVCYVAWGGGEHGVEEYQVLCGCAAKWVPTQGANVPSGALPAGETEEGEPLFVGRAEHEGTLTVGKVQGSHGVCYIPYAGQELGFDTYDVLVV